MEMILVLTPVIGITLGCSVDALILTTNEFHTIKGVPHGREIRSQEKPKRQIYDRRTSKKGEPYFVLKAGNGQIIGNSEMYSSTAAMENGIQSVKTNGPTAPVEDNT